MRRHAQQRPVRWRCSHWPGTSPIRRDVMRLDSPTSHGPPSWAPTECGTRFKTTRQLRGLRTVLRDLRLRRDLHALIGASLNCSAKSGCDASFTSPYNSANERPEHRGSLGGGRRLAKRLAQVLRRELHSLFGFIDHRAHAEELVGHTFKVAIAHGHPCLTQTLGVRFPFRAKRIDLRCDDRGGGSPASFSARRTDRRGSLPSAGCSRACS